MRELRAGVIGTGQMGKYHVRIYAELMGIKLAAVCDINKERANEVANQYNTIAYDDYRQLFGKVDFVSIAVPTSLHYKVAKDFLSAGIPVLLEKPMTRTIEEGKELFRIAKAKGVVLHVGHVERFNAAVQELKNIVENPMLIETRRLGPYNPRVKDIGVVMDLMIHDIDIILNLVNSEVEKINVIGNSVYSEHEDLANIQMVFKSGCLANITASRVTEHKIRTLAVTQKDAYIFLDYTDQDLHIHRQAASEYRLTKEALRYKQESFIERIFVHKDNPLKLEILYFINNVIKKKKSNSEMEDLRSLAMALDVVEMLKKQKMIKNAS
ncbi:MAG: Gfo/Idh/MocA family oxidoreductase [bacterium]|nr:Gfo/Idh/MocA family oxidoreductase [bacterium]